MKVPVMIVVVFKDNTCVCPRDVTELPNYFLRQDVLRVEFREQTITGAVKGIVTPDTLKNLHEYPVIY